MMNYTLKPIKTLLEFEFLYYVYTGFFYLKQKTLSILRPLHKTLVMYVDTSRMYLYPIRCSRGIWEVLVFYY